MTLFMAEQEDVTEGTRPRPAPQPRSSPLTWGEAGQDELELWAVWSRVETTGVGLGVIAVDSELIS